MDVGEIIVAYGQALVPVRRMMNRSVGDDERPGIFVDVFLEDGYLVQPMAGPNLPQSRLQQMVRYLPLQLHLPYVFSFALAAFDVMSTNVDVGDVY